MVHTEAMVAERGKGREAEAEARMGQHLRSGHGRGHSSRDTLHAAHGIALLVYGTDLDTLTRASEGVRQ